MMQCFSDQINLCALDINKDQCKKVKTEIDSALI